MGAACKGVTLRVVHCIAFIYGRRAPRIQPAKAKAAFSQNFLFFKNLFSVSLYFNFF